MLNPFKKIKPGDIPDTETIENSVDSACEFISNIAGGEISDEQKKIVKVAIRELYDEYIEAIKRNDDAEAFLPDAAKLYVKLMKAAMAGNKEADNLRLILEPHVLEIKGVIG